MPFRASDRTATSRWLCAVALAAAGLGACSEPVGVDRGDPAAHPTAAPTAVPALLPSSTRVPRRWRGRSRATIDVLRFDVATPIPTDTAMARDLPPPPDTTPGDVLAPQPITLNALQVDRLAQQLSPAPIVALARQPQILAQAAGPAAGRRPARPRAGRSPAQRRRRFDVYHITVIDPRATCSTFEDCLRVVATWSGAHPPHTPIFIWIEIKDDTGGQPIDDPAGAGGGRS